MNPFKQTLIRRLEERGVEQSIIPGFMRSFAGFFFQNPQMNLMQVNTRLRYLGWNDFDLDYHTFQLAVACFEIDGLKSICQPHRSA